MDNDDLIRKPEGFSRQERQVLKRRSLPRGSSCGNRERVTTRLGTLGGDLDLDLERRRWCSHCRVIVVGVLSRAKCRSVEKATPNQPRPVKPTCVSTRACFTSLWGGAGLHANVRAAVSYCVERSNSSGEARRSRRPVRLRGA